METRSSWIAGRPGFGASVVAGVVAGALVLSGGLAFLAFFHPSRWSAEASVAVFPPRTVQQDTLARYYRTLSMGQVVTTVYAVLSQDRLHDSVGKDLGYSKRRRRREIDVTSKIVPGSALITVRATAPSRRVAEAMVDGVVAAAAPDVAAAVAPFTIGTLSSARGTGERAGIPGPVFVVLVLIVALVAGLVSQQAVYYLGRLLRTARTRGWRNIPAGGGPDMEPAEAVLGLNGRITAVEHDADGDGAMPGDQPASSRPHTAGQ